MHLIRFIKKIKTDEIKLGHIDINKIGLYLLIISFFIGVFSIYITLYNAADESDVLTLGRLISKGSLLYVDYFSHHFPFSYIWTASVFSIFGSSIQAIRLSMLLLRVFIFYLTMKLSNHYFIIGLTSVSWSLLSYLYLGNMVLYDSFCAIFNIAAFVVTLAIITNRVKDSYDKYLFIGILSSLSVFSDPTKIFPLFVLFLGLVIHNIKKYYFGRKKTKQILLRFMVLIISFSIVGIIFLTYFIFTASLNNFIKDAIEFNYYTYSKYAGSLEISNFVKQFLSLFDIFNKAWYKELKPLFKLDNFLELLDSTRKCNFAGQKGGKLR